MTQDGRCRIVLTGGPGAGKTTAADLFRREIGVRGELCLDVGDERAELVGVALLHDRERALRQHLERCVIRTQPTEEWRRQFGRGGSLR